MNDANFLSIVPNKDTVETVMKKFGPPVINSVVPYDDGSYCWYYIGGVATESIMGEKTEHYQKYMIKFSKSGIVLSVTKMGNDNDVSMNRKQTKVEGHNYGFFKESFGGMGRYIKRFDSFGK